MSAAGQAPDRTIERQALELAWAVLTRHGGDFNALAIRVSLALPDFHRFERELAERKLFALRGTNSLDVGRGNLVYRPSGFLPAGTGVLQNARGDVVGILVIEPEGE